MISRIPPIRAVSTLSWFPLTWVSQSRPAVKFTVNRM